ncbi:hypothetical protein [Dokdonella sp.]|uniref:esterase/lipase family protein n=1 Tax=Dokdonella sp. TaxID=2291710 RepID=UPI001B1340DB|nr:hypothetical protein [Dokdonella sp.]MBO9662899.1 hypothetical protein [Dokdonella sp.]
MREIDDAILHPIIYVRGYAMTAGEKDQTAADPFCGFNVGSTVYRAVADRAKAAQRFYFESPLVRLMTDFGYSHAYQRGLDILSPESDGVLPRKCIVIHRFYDETAPLFGGEQEASLENFAKGLSDLILKIRERVCADPKNGITKRQFRCYLVAHSMGGLVCRALLQNRRYGDPAARSAVAKFFTYATPHNGIDMAGINVPSWLSPFEMNTFNRKNLANDLDLDAQFQKRGRVDWLLKDAGLPIENVFCMVGTNRNDYDVAAGLSRAFAGHGSDGLVRVENACVCQLDTDSDEQTQAATAYAYRSHSGPFGIVNSEESYQNLTRFLFGDVRIDVWVEVEQVTLPAAIDGQREVEALYQFEVLASPRGKPWYLTRRVAEEDSVACRTHTELTSPGPSPAGDDRHQVYLSTVFLAKSERVDPSRASLAYSLTLGVRVPDYAVKGSLWLKEHYEGTYLFRDTIIVEISPPADDAGNWVVKYGWQSKSPSAASEPLAEGQLGDDTRLKVPFDSRLTPGMRGSLVFRVRAWNKP